MRRDHLAGFKWLGEIQRIYEMPSLKTSGAVVAERLDAQTSNLEVCGSILGLRVRP